jgi:hypothetical protein
VNERLSGEVFQISGDVEIRFENIAINLGNEALFFWKLNELEVLNPLVELGP